MANVINIGGGAGGSGSSVVANPQGAATDTLVKLGIEGTIYDFAGSGSGSSYSETELLSTPVQVGASSITLTDNISNYDLLVFEIGVFANNVNQLFTSVALVSNIVNNPSDITFISGAESDNNKLYSVYFGITYSSETQLTIISSERTGWGETGQIISIKGIKYGNGNGSGHNYSTTEQVVGTWIDGKTLYGRTLVLRENGVDKYTFTGHMGNGGFYAVGLTGIDKIWLEGLYSKRGKSGDTDYTDIDNNSTEVVTVFKHSDGSFYFKNTHAPTDIILIIRYTKTTT